MIVTACPFPPLADHSALIFSAYDPRVVGEIINSVNHRSSWGPGGIPPYRPWWGILNFIQIDCGPELYPALMDAG